VKWPPTWELVSREFEGWQLSRVPQGRLRRDGAVVGLTVDRSSVAEWGSGGIAPSFLTSELDEGEWSDSRPGRFIRQERAPGVHCVGGCMNLRAGLSSVE
jgi:hypothetical protein